MAAAALLRSVAREMSRAAAPTHHPSIVARSGPANSKQGTADVLVSAGMAAATSRLGSGAGRLTTKMAHAPPPPPYHRLVHGRGIHSRTSPDPIPSTPRKVPDTTALDKFTAGMAYIALVSAVIYVHFWLKPKVDRLTAMHKDLREKSSHLVNMLREQNMNASSVSHETLTAPASAGHGNTADKGTGFIDKLGGEGTVKMMMHSQVNRVKELEATIMDLKAENAKLKIALDSARSQGKV